ncbi:TIGR03769 domain-containing protein [Streptomyces malaysiensis]|uniref:TIGR03769 domain-containing protein n=1 Tax=Streptomyces malaysiensis TaxID=92644 RepID=UPI0036B6BD04
MTRRPAPRWSVTPPRSRRTWAFEAKGDYTLTFQAIGTLTDGTTVNSGAVDYHFTVG